MQNSKNHTSSHSPNHILLELYEASYDRVFQSSTLDYLHCSLSDIAAKTDIDLAVCHNQIRGLFLPLCSAIYTEAAQDEFLQSNHPQLILLWKKVKQFLQEGPYSSDSPNMGSAHFPYEALMQSCQTINRIVAELELIHFEVSITQQSSLVYLLSIWLDLYSDSVVNAFAP